MMQHRFFLLLLLLFEVPGTGASRCHNRTRMWVPTPPPTRQPLVETHRMCLGSECALFYLFISVFSSFLFFFFLSRLDKRNERNWAHLSVTQKRIGRLRLPIKKILFFFHRFLSGMTPPHRRKRGGTRKVGQQAPIQLQTHSRISISTCIYMGRSFLPTRIHSVSVESGWLVSVMFADAWQRSPFLDGWALCIYDTCQALSTSSFLFFCTLYSLFPLTREKTTT